ncbi:MAG: hypothetical protein QXR18_09720 [Pyrobaculum sp.]
MRVVDLLGINAYALIQYGVWPDDDINTAIEKLRVKAPHLATLLEKISDRPWRSER